ncbi:carbon-nitrogen hydrolase family protein [Sphingomonas suaedae]|uniref:Carbon-nitrogen hydrolase family protein n=1 Tax=Sphingomonas suaedae TaxID=2599297 RepID=A0A518RHK4_9SPHN|nr:carbon-nitrogen hydrolase family protein [Sphingomonas suaedae]QDX26921.1 carbon-nitrogen hydrolase family protein [Sphingomonas suaedae]
MDRLTVAIVQRPPVFLDLAASTARAVEIIADAGRDGAGLVVFPETWLPGYPIWVDEADEVARWEHPGADALFAHLFANSAKRDGAEIAALAKAAADAGADVVMGMHERAGRTLYNTTLTLGADGSRYARRKLVPTHGERLLWGRGDGSTLDVVERPYGRLGSLVCWEHWMPLARAAMHARAEDIHVAQWPSVEWRHLLVSRSYAFEGQCVVIAAGCALSLDDVLDGFDHAGGDRRARSLLETMSSERLLKNGGSTVIAPDATFLCEPAEREPIVWASLDIAELRRRTPYLDVSGHYARPDVFELRVDTRPRSDTVFGGGSQPPPPTAP